MLIFDYEQKLHNLLINHLNQKYIFEDYFDLLKQENNSFLNYILAHAYFVNKDFENAEKYRQIAVNLNSNYEFENDYAKIQDYIFRLLSTITTQFFDDKNSFEDNLSSEQDYYNLSEIQRKNNNISFAASILDKGLSKYPNSTLLQYALASNLLYTRNINSAWEYNEQRFDEVRKKLPQYIDRPKFEFQKNSAKVYIYPVTKLGDTIFFARYIFKLKEEYPSIRLFVSPDNALKTLFEQNGIRTYNKPERSMVDYQISFEGLPYLFRNQDVKILRHGYLKAKKEKAEEYKQQYFNTDKFKVGIIWRTSKPQDARNVPVESFKPLFDSKNVQFYSLQKDITFQEEMVILKYGIPNLGVKFKDFSDTAAAIDNLDLVIGCDTSVTNLAGAMNKKTIIILPYNADWRWGLFEQQSEWYDSVQLYRQKENQGLEEIISRINNFISKAVNN